MNVTDLKWGIIVNPKAGKKRFNRDKEALFKLAEDNNIIFEAHCTEYAGHATKLASSLVNKGILNILIIGGDGTINEVVNGIFTSNIEDKSKVSISVLPYGTGNDWARYWGLLTKERRKITPEIFQREKNIVDVGKATYTEDGEKKIHYFINGAGFGFDAQVVKITNHLKKYLGGSAWTYSLSVLSAVFSYSPTKMKLQSPDKQLDNKVFTIAIGNSCYSGGGLKQAPKAVPNDGLLHITAITQLTFMKIIKGLKDLFSNNLDNHPCANNFVTDTFSVEQDTLLHFETDGVLLPKTTKIEIQLIKNALGMYA